MGEETQGRRSIGEKWEGMQRETGRNEDAEEARRRLVEREEMQGRTKTEREEDCEISGRDAH